MTLANIHISFRQGNRVFDQDYVVPEAQGAETESLIRLVFNGSPNLSVTRNDAKGRAQTHHVVDVDGTPQIRKVEVSA